MNITIFKISKNWANILCFSIRTSFILALDILILVGLVLVKTGLSTEHNSTKSQETYLKTERLIKQLESNDYEVRMNAMKGLVNLKDPGLVDLLLRALGDNDFNVRETAATALGEIENVRATDSLIRALNDHVFYVRKAAASALGKIGDTRAVFPLYIALSDNERVVREAAVDSLRKLGDPAGQFFYQSLCGSKEAFEKLLEVRDQRFLELVAKAFPHWDSTTRENAVWILGKFQDEWAFKLVIEGLSDKSPAVRNAAAWSLSKIGDSRAVEPLLNVADDINPQVREAAVWSLGKIGDRRAMEKLINAMNDPDERIRTAAAYGLGNLGKSEPSFDQLIKALNDQNEKVREAAVSALYRMGNRRAVPAIIRALKDPSAAVRRAAAYTLGQIGDECVIGPLFRLVEDTDTTVREATVSSLSKLNEPLGRLIDNSFKGSHKAMKELILRRDRRATELFIRALNSRDLQVRKVAALYLGEINEQQALDGLIRMARSWRFHDRISGMAAISKLHLDGIREAFSIALGLFFSVPSLIYFLLATFFFFMIVCWIPLLSFEKRLLYRIIIGSCMGGILFFLPTLSFSWICFSFAVTGISPFILLSTATTASFILRRRSLQSRLVFLAKKKERASLEDSPLFTPDSDYEDENGQILKGLSESGATDSQDLPSSVDDTELTEATIAPTPEKTQAELERRNKVTRIEVTWPITVFTDEGTIEGETRNITAAGMFIKCREPLRVNETYRISIRPPNRQAIELTCKVIWSNLYGIDGQDTAYAMRFHFVKVSDEDRHLLSDTISAHQEY